MKHYTLLALAGLTLQGCAQTVATTAIALPVGYAADIGINCVRGGECGDTISGDTGDAMNAGSTFAKGLCVAYEMSGVSLWDAGYFDSCSWKVFNAKLGTETETNNHCTRTSYYEARRKIRFADGTSEWDRVKAEVCL